MSVVVLLNSNILVQNASLSFERQSFDTHSSTQLTYFQDKLTKNVNEVSTIEKNNTPISHAEQFSKFSESQNVAEKFCSHPFKTVLKEKDPIPPKVIYVISNINTFMKVLFL